MSGIVASEQIPSERPVLPLAPWLPLSVSISVALVLALVPAQTSNDMRILGVVVFVAQTFTLIYAAMRTATRVLSTNSVVEVLLGASVIGLSIPYLTIIFLGSLSQLSLLPSLLLAGALETALLILSRQSPKPSTAFMTVALRRLIGLSLLERYILLLASLAFAVLLLRAITYPSTDNDEMFYHLPMVAEWIINGHIAPSPSIPAIARGYPGAREAVLTWLSLPLRSDNLALLSLVELPLALVAVFGLCRHFGAPVGVALGMAVAFLTVPAVAAQGTSQKNDVFLAIAFSITLFFLVRASRTGRIAHASLAGLAGGLLAATKFTGPVYLLVLVLLALPLASLRRPRLSTTSAGPAAKRLLLCPAVLAFMIAVATSAVWYIRNAVFLGNPLYPSEVALFGRVIFDGPLTRGDVAAIAIGTDIMRIFPHVSELLFSLGYALPLLALAPVGLAVQVATRRIDGRSDNIGVEAGLWLVVLPITLALVYLYQPFGLVQRGSESFRMPARFLLPLLLCLHAALASLLARPPLVAQGLCGVAAIVVMLNMPLWTRHWVVIALAAAVVAVLGSTLVGSDNRDRRARSSIYLIALPLVAFLVLVGVWLEGFRETQKADRDYGLLRHGSWEHVSLYVRQNLSRARILSLGYPFTYPLYGPGFTNRIFLPPNFDIEDIRARVLGPRFSNFGLPEGFDVVGMITRLNIDYVVGFRPIVDRRGGKGQHFVWGEAPTRALRSRYPDLFQLVYANDGAEVVRVTSSTASRHPHRAARQSPSAPETMPRDLPVARDHMD